MNRWIGFLWAEMKRDAGRQEPTHLQGADRLDPSRQCPSQVKYPICCPCSSTSVTATLAPKLGPTLIMVSAALVSNWIAEWDKSVDSRPGPLQMRLRVGWPSAPGDRQLTRAGDLQLMQADPATGGAKHGQDRTVVLTTSGSYSGHVAKILEKRWTTTEQVRADSRALNPKTRQVWHTADQVRWGRIIRDEAHKDEAATTTANQLIRRLRERQVSQDERAPAGTSLQGPSSVWFLSGTSIEVGPQDLTGLVACLDVNSSTWSQRIDGLERCIQAVLETLQVEFNRHVQSSNPAAKDLTDLEEGFSHVLRQLMIRRTIKTRWYDGLPCIRLPPFFARDVAVNVGARWFAKLEEIAEEVKARLYQEAAAQQKRWVQLGSKPDQKPKPTTNAYFRYANKLKVCSSFPYLKTMMEAHEVETLTLAELTPKKEPSWFVRAENPLTRRLPELVASSPKLEAIRRIMGRQGVDWQQRPEKLVIMSGSPYVAYIVYLVRLFLPSPFMITDSEAVAPVHWQQSRALSRRPFDRQAE